MPARLTPDEIDQKADELAAQVAGLRAVAAEARKRGLQSVNVHSIVDQMDAHAQALAKSGGHAQDILIRKANAKKHTLGTLAAASGVSKALISMARKGTRSIPESVAKRIAELTGFEATAKNWPGGIVSGK